MKCSQCDEMVWRFDMRKHFTKKHPEKQVPSTAVVPEADKLILTKKKEKLKERVK